MSNLVRACNGTLHTTSGRFVLIRAYQTTLKNDMLLTRQKRLKRVEEMLDAFRRKLVVLGRVDAGEEVGKHLLAHVRFCTIVFC